MNSLRDIERVIDDLTPYKLAEFYAMVDRHRAARGATVFEQGLGLFGSPEDAALLDEIVAFAYAKRGRPSPGTRKGV